MLLANYIKQPLVGKGLIAFKNGKKAQNNSEIKPTQPQKAVVSGGH